MNVLIVSGGNIEINLLKEILKDYEQIIAVDKGLESLHELNKTPNYIVGDLDSIKNEILELYKNVEICKYNPEKDYTDTDLGLKLALSLKPEKITIIGGIGTRIDHTLANIHILKNCLGKNIKCEILDSHNKIYLIDSYTEIEKKNIYGKYFSIIPLTSKAKGITLKGFKYPLNNYILEIGKSLGISNEIIEEKASIEIREGILIVIESRD